MTKKQALGFRGGAETFPVSQKESEAPSEADLLSQTPVVQVGKDTPAFVETVDAVPETKVATTEPHSLSESVQRQLMSLVSLSLSDAAPLREQGATQAFHSAETVGLDGDDIAPDLNGTPSTPVADGRADFVALRTIGEGGMGHVSLAKQTSLQRVVALKQIKAQQINDNNVRALLHEARLTGRLEHPNIVPVHALGRDGQGRPVMIMKYIEGTTWHAMIHNDEHPMWDDVTGDRLTWHLQVLQQVCHAVHFAHSRGVLHRDIKPTNVMIGDFGEVYLLDWGIAASMEGASAPLGDSRDSHPILVGSPAYLAPELLREHPATPDERTDVYLLGSTLHEILTGEPPHSSQQLPELLEEILASTPARYDDRVPDELVAICHRAMHQQPEERFASAQDLRKAVDAFLQHRSSASLSDSVSERFGELRALLSETEPSKRNHELIYQLFYECRFAWSQSLQLWPENERAADSFEECLGLMFQHECALQHHAAARALWQQMKAPGPSLKLQLDELASTLAADEITRQKIVQWQQEADEGPARAERIRLFKYFFLTAMGTGIFFVILRFMGFKLLVPVFRIVFLSVLCTVYGIVVWLYRERLLSNMYNRLLAFPILVGMVLMILWRLLALRLGLSMGETMAAEAVMMACMASYAGFVLHRIAWLHGALALCCGALISLKPERAPAFQFIFLSIALIATFVSMKWRSTRRELPPPSV